MVGDDRVRYCAKCELHVYNLSEMSRQDVMALVGERKGRLCGRFYARADGSLINQPRVMLPIPRVRRAYWLTAMLSAALAVGSASAQEAARPVGRAADVELRTFSTVVTDASGAVIPGAHIQLTSWVGKTLEGVTDEEGRFEITGVADTPYQLVITATGFVPFSKLVSPATKPLRVTLEGGGGVDGRDCGGTNRNRDEPSGYTAGDTAIAK